MTAAELIAILKRANGAELAEIRSLLGMPIFMPAPAPSPPPFQPPYPQPPYLPGSPYDPYRVTCVSGGKQAPSLCRGSEDSTIG